MLDRVYSIVKDKYLLNDAASISGLCKHCVVNSYIYSFIHSLNPNQTAKRSCERRKLTNQVSASDIIIHVRDMNSGIAKPETYLCKKHELK